MTANFTKKAALILALISLAGHATSQSAVPTPAVDYSGRLPYRNEFIGYSLRELAETGDRGGERNFLPLERFYLDTEGEAPRYVTTVSLPDWWTERVVTLHTEGGRNSHRAYVNGLLIGSARDSRVPSEFDITAALRTGPNEISIEIVDDTSEPESALTGERAGLENIFLYVQPRARIWDYDVLTRLDGADGHVEMELCVENYFGDPQDIEVGFDIFGPDGRLVEYGIEKAPMTGRGRDTLSFSATVWGAAKNTWSAANPALYQLIFFIRKDGYVTEYVPLTVGFGALSWDKGGISRSGKRIEISAEGYDATTPKQLRADIRSAKKRGVNTFSPAWPQPHWFYDACDAMGMYVIDQVNINSSHQPGNLRVGGALANDPAWLGEYMERTRAAFMRSRSHVCIIAWSLGGEGGNGYNLYKTYQWLKAADPSRPVIYRGAGGEWNSDEK